ncbi:prephenate dehydrogenase/arogenate dehydrogenase family protein [Methylorubrum extorquens]|uniref:prephenate dehydrogenase/arogenate dehydrogenase family protein n=1 Tax=Methylorubrum extorquens TaxID=408 RepID=UPI000158FE59|nr:prephenate dehydrogenase [Methylorubrum extorquens]ABY32381.1 Prephenate dehydrogenase [Methylorubrum extorquens PA1]KQP95896.1 prephenate dehydrogenase [Methylobacterium sp. Leaf119]WIU38985.1 prephenate dehydrogenase [Methylorubrum extorquens]
MSALHSSAPAPSVGLVGFGAFGRLIARHLAPHARLTIHDPYLPAGMVAAQAGPEAVAADLRHVAACPVVILATPVARLGEAVRALAPHLRPGTLVVDVGSVKAGPAAILVAGLPADVEILATHPLFGPQSAGDGIRGLKIAVCPIRGRGAFRAAAFLRRGLGLDVILTTPEAHDRAMASVQGLTHLIAKVLVAMEPLPTRMTTRSFDLLMQAVGMVRDDAPDVFHAIERANPHAAQVRQRFFALAGQLDAELAGEAVPAAPVRLAS